MLYNVEMDKKDNALIISGPEKYLLELIQSFTYGIEHNEVVITVKNKKVYIRSEKCDLDDLAECIILDDWTLEYGNVKELIPPQYPVVADWEG